MRYLSILLLFIVACQSEPEPAPAYLNHEITIGSRKDANLWVELDDSTLYYDVDNYWGRPAVLGWVDLDLNGDDLPEVRFQSSIVKIRSPRTEPYLLNGQPHIRYFFYSKLSIHPYDSSAEWLIAKEGKHVDRLFEGEVVDLSNAQFEKFTIEKDISYCNVLDVPVVADEKTGGWWRTQESSFLVIYKINGIMNASVVTITVQDFLSVVIHSIATYPLE